MEDFQELALQGAEEALHQGWIIKVKRVFPLEALEEIPVEQGMAMIMEPIGEDLQLGGRVGQMLQYIQADHGGS